MVKKQLFESKGLLALLMCENDVLVTGLIGRVIDASEYEDFEDEGIEDHVCILIENNADHQKWAFVEVQNIKQILLLQ